MHRNRKGKKGKKRGQFAGPCQTRTSPSSNLMANTHSAQNKLSIFDGKHLVSGERVSVFLAFWDLLHCLAGKDFGKDLKSI